MLTALFLERSTSHQLQRLPVGAAQGTRLCRTPLPSAGVWLQLWGLGPEDSDFPASQRPSGGPHCAPSACSIPSAGQPWPWGQSSWQGAGSQVDCSGKGLCAHLRSLRGIRLW